MKSFQGANWRRCRSPGAASIESARSNHEVSLGRDGGARGNRPLQGHREIVGEKVALQTDIVVGVIVQLNPIRVVVEIDDLREGRDVRGNELIQAYRRGIFRRNKQTAHSSQTEAGRRRENAMDRQSHFLSWKSRLETSPVAQSQLPISATKMSQNGLASNLPFMFEPGFSYNRGSLNGVVGVLPLAFFARRRRSLFMTRRACSSGSIARL